MSNSGKGIIKNLLIKWRNYRFRLVPWIALNLQGRVREQAREVQMQTDALVPANELVDTLLALLPKLHQQSSYGPEHLARINKQVMLKHLGFAVDRAPSGIENGGIGVFLIEGQAKRGQLVALYPGTIYKPYEPILLPSISNPYILQCLDGLHVDGKDNGLSKIIFKSLRGRYKMGPHEIADVSWLTQYPINPLNIGQYVNNYTKEQSCNVAYQECELPRDFPGSLLSLLPYVPYSAPHPRRVVALVAAQDIDTGAEILSSYFTLVTKNA